MSTFLDDFAFFEGNGIGREPRISCHPLEPRIGTTATLKFETAGRPLHVTVDGSRIDNVRDGETHPIRLDQDREYEAFFSDLETDTPIPPTFKLRPHVDEPQIDNLLIPEHVAYHGKQFRIFLQTRDVESIDAKWRLRSAPRDWHEMLSERGALIVPIPPRPDQLELSILFKSAHAHWCDRGTKCIVRHVSVRHPDPEIHWVSSKREFRRHEAASVELQCSWVSGLFIESESETPERRPNPAKQIIASVSLSTNVLGDHTVRIRAYGLDGTMFAQQFEYTVLPRIPEIVLKPNSDGSVAFDIKGGVLASLHMPARHLDLDILCSRGTITHGFLIPTEAVLIIIDDAGKQHERRIVLFTPKADRGGSKK